MIKWIKVIFKKNLEGKEWIDFHVSKKVSSNGDKLKLRHTRLYILKKKPKVDSKHDIDLCGLWWTLLILNTITNAKFVCSYRRLQVYPPWHVVLQNLKTSFSLHIKQIIFSFSNSNQRRPHSHQRFLFYRCLLFANPTSKHHTNLFSRKKENNSNKTEQKSKFNPITTEVLSPPSYWTKTKKKCE